MAVGDLAFYYTLYLWKNSIEGKSVVSYTDFIALAPSRQTREGASAIKSV